MHDMIQTEAMPFIFFCVIDEYVVENDHLHYIYMYADDLCLC